MKCNIMTLFIHIQSHLSQFGIVEYITRNCIIINHGAAHILAELADDKIDCKIIMKIRFFQLSIRNENKIYYFK